MTNPPEDNTAELGAALIVIAVLLIATVILSVLGLRGADDTPLAGETSSSASSTQVTATTEMASDLYASPPPCDSFSAALVAEVPIIGGSLGSAALTSTDTSQSCEFQLRKGGWLKVVSTYYPADETPGYQQASAALVAGGGTVLSTPRLGDAAMLRPCDGATCSVAIQHHNVLVEITVTVGETSLAGSSQAALLRIASDYAGTNLL